MRRRERLFHQADRARRRGLVLCRGPLALRRRRGGGEGRHPRLSSRARPGAGPQIAFGIRRQDHHRPAPRRGGAGPAAASRASSSPRPAPSPAAISAPPSTPGWRRSAPGCRRRCCGGWPAPTAPASRPCSATPTPRRPRPPFRRRPLRGGGALSDRDRIRAHRRGHTVAPHQARPDDAARRSRRRWRTGLEQPPPCAVERRWKA